ncbi:MAG: 50S ribosomal protein L33 [Planctomycetota bacterium]
MAREYVWLECIETGMRIYRITKEAKGTERLQLRKYNRHVRRHVLCKETRKK